MNEELSGVLDGLRKNNVLPESRECVFVTGSIVRGWGNPTSDLDVTVVVTEPWTSSVGNYAKIALTPDTIQYEGAHVDGRRWDIAYWLDTQVDQMFEKLSWENMDNTVGPWHTLSSSEIAVLEKFPYAVAVDGHGWLERRKDELANTAHRSVFASHDLHYADSYIEDAAGLLQVGDLDAAVLAARLAFGHAVDGLCASLGEFGSKWPKWRARRVRNASPAVLSFEEYWAIETMRDLDPANPSAWVEHVVRTCQKISLDVQL